MAPPLIYLVCLSIFAVLGSTTEHECRVEKCRHTGPAIRFPFTLKDRHQHQCGYPGFQLHCNQNKDTVLELPFPLKASIKDSELPYTVQFSVKDINYKYQTIEISEVHGCLPGLLPILNLSASPFQFQRTDDFTLFNCSKMKRNYLYRIDPVPCLSTSVYDVYAAWSGYPLVQLPLYFCNKIFSVPSIPFALFDRRFPLSLNWSTPFCGDCEATGKHCRLKNDSLILHHIEIECYKSKPPDNFNGLVIISAI